MANSADLIDAFCDQLWLQDGLAASSLSSYRRDLNAWAAWLGARGMLAADRGDVEGWLAQQFRARSKATSVARRLRKCADQTRVGIGKNSSVVSRS